VEKKYLIVCLMLQQPWILRDLLAKLCLMELQKLYAGKEIDGLLVKNLEVHWIRKSETPSSHKNYACLSFESIAKMQLPLINCADLKRICLNCYGTFSILSDQQ
jgi:hypothetical protein